MISCHGDEGGIILEGLPLDDDAGVLSPARLTPELLRQHARLDGRVVIATGCATGSAEMARAILDAGCASYIAPDGYPQISAEYDLADLGLSVTPAHAN